jgi:hypothetical protein
MVCWSWPYGMVPLPWNRRCSILKTVEILTHRPHTCIILVLESGNMLWYVVMTILGGPTDASPLLKQEVPLLSLKLLRSPPLNYRYKSVGFPGSDLHCTLHEIVIATKENKMHIHGENLLSIGQGDSGERCGPRASCFPSPLEKFQF